MKHLSFQTIGVTEESRLQSHSLSIDSHLIMNNIAISDYRPVPYNGAESQLQQSHHLSPEEQSDFIVKSGGMIIWKIPGFQAKFRTSLKNWTFFGNRRRPF